MKQLSSHGRPLDDSSAWVLDASAVLAVVHREAGWQSAMARLAGSAVSSLNWSEVLQKLAQKGVSEELLRNAVVGHRLTVAPFTAEDARRTADLWPLTRSLGLSLADRACLALAQSTGRGVVTADRAWAQLDMGLSIFVIR